MKTNYFINLLLMIMICSCQDQKRYYDNLTDFQLQLNANYRDASTSPLTKKDLKNFNGLDFFRFDSSYVVIAKINTTPNDKPFKMKTTTDRVADYRKYGDLNFTLKGKDLKLSVYENLEYVGIEEYKNYLFLPYLDMTNGFETYGGGRYINLSLEKEDEIIVDFNKSFNPPCVYDPNYSCPIVPRENLLPIRIEAGVKEFAKN